VTFSSRGSAYSIQSAGAVVPPVSSEAKDVSYQMFDSIFWAGPVQVGHDETPVCTLKEQIDKMVVEMVVEF
jgi:hypothetical protein